MTVTNISLRMDRFDLCIYCLCDLNDGKFRIQFYMGAKLLRQHYSRGYSFSDLQIKYCLDRFGQFWTAIPNSYPDKD